MGTGCSYCAFENGIKVLEWKGKLEKFDTVFQAELMGLKEATIRVSQGNEITKIWTDSHSSVMAVLDLHTPHQFVRDIQYLLTQNRNILDRSKPMLAISVMKKQILLPKKAITESVVVKALKPRCKLKHHLQELFF
ncbi:hypothetical protein AVEN_161396-1 [Araneus ventricosus]|uniref:RNase H type-1 domain-containing protein n=1 Tax=Araneus ventricosus TaxID=182803 RepID=A0A4Y2FKX5_ARAVE|nr:hypothetical protein AVEN_161396-1 [Araneus ventricosus]